ncbi:phage tail fiber protein [Muricoccus radiodurans]|uniref:phage tail fiber protein n=1 Tax=Muricoccus radiodurans TaxID=2231721 RepID=UPI003CF44607
MSDLTDYARNLLARALCGRAPALPGAVYAALGTGATVASGLSGEPAGNGYARQRVTFTGTGVQRNAEAIRFVFSAAAGTISHVGLYDAATGGNPLVVSPLNSSVVMSGPGTVTLAAESLVVNPT